jgi:hypothetical protein
VLRTLLTYLLHASEDPTDYYLPVVPTLESSTLLIASFLCGVLVRLCPQPNPNTRTLNIHNSFDFAKESSLIRRNQHATCNLQLATCNIHRPSFYLFFLSSVIAHASSRVVRSFCSHVALFCCMSYFIHFCSHVNLQHIDHRHSTTLRTYSIL